MIGVKWDHKLKMWVVYNKNTGKILYKNSSEVKAVRYRNSLLGEER